MTRYYPGATVEVRTEVRDTDGVLVDAPNITMTWKNGKYGSETSETPVHVSTGLYKATFVPETGGNHYIRWDTETTEQSGDVADEQIIPVRDSSFDDFR